eukprot:6488561-Prymnesium_polylepis.1
MALEVVAAVSELASLAVDAATSPLKGGHVRGLDFVSDAILLGSPAKAKHDAGASPRPELHTRAKGRRRFGLGLGCCRPSARVEPDLWVVEPAPSRAPARHWEDWRSADGTDAHGRPAAA